jgi:hypothetical protein
VEPSLGRRLSQLRIVPLLALPALLARLCTPAPPPATLSGMADMLGAAAGCAVDPDGFVWEPSRGPVLDTVLGRRVIFLGRAGEGSPRDVFRASVRVSLEGHPISVERVVNLSDSPFGDEQGLVANGTHVAYATVSFGSVQQVTLLNLTGAAHPDGTGVLDGLMARLTNVQETGSIEGLGRTEVSANIKGRSTALSMDQHALYVSVDGGRSRFAIDLGDGSVIGGPGLQQEGVSSIVVPPLRKPPIIWAVDTVRGMLGPEPIAWLEEQTFGVRDLLKKAAHRTLGGASSEHEKLREGAIAAPPPPPPPSRPVGADGLAEDGSWPPQNLRTIWEEPDPREGEWRAPKKPFLKKLKSAGAAGAPPTYFLESFVRPDPERPYSKVLLVAMDSRQLELGMEGGIEDPKPLTGARGEGRIPRDPEVLSRVVGAFNGAFKTTHGEYGMMVNRRVLLPPKPGAATVMITQDRRAGFGTWPASTEIPQDMLSFRQNLEPLVEGQQLNPSNRKQWGWHLHGTRMLTHRSGLCVTSTGHMVYAWGAEVTGETLGRAMIQAGCAYAIHLDMNPHHTAFAYLDIRNPSTKDYDAELLTPEMEVMPDRFILWSPKDFFYLTLREPLAPKVDGISFEADPGAQPSPAWEPAIWSAKVRSEGVTVRVWAIAEARAEFRVRRGGETSLEAGDAQRVLGAVEMVLPSEPPRGNAIPKQQAPAARATVWLSADDTGRLALEHAQPSRGGIPLLLLERAGEKGTWAGRAGERRPRSAMCRTDTGWMFAARANATSYKAVVEVLERMGCKAIVALDPDGGQARFHRTGTDDPPMDRYDHAAVYVVAKRPSPGAFVWSPQ